MKTVYERSNLGKFRPMIFPCPTPRHTLAAPLVGPLSDYPAAAALAKDWAHHHPGANVEVVQVTDQYRGAVEVLQVEEINSD